MVISSQDKSSKINNLCLYLLVITTMIGPMIYIGFASLYHFVVFGFLLFVFLKGIYTGNYKTPIMIFLALWLCEALISVLWSPDKMLSLQYVYYIFLIAGICILFHYFLSRDNLIVFSHFMVVVLLLCNLIAFWEINTGNHLVKDYLSTALRLRLLKYVPGGFYSNPNDFATFIIQIIPFSFMCLTSNKKWVRCFSGFNLIASFVTVCATQSRTQILLLLGMYIFFAFVFRKKTLVKYIFFVCVIAVALYFTYPEFHNVVDGALKSVSGKSLVSNIVSDGGSLNIRINLLKNAGHILLDTFGFGIGAGCHRVVMANYSTMYFDTYNILVMHNLLGEIFVDYGIIIGIAFIYAIVRSCYHLIFIYKSESNYSIRMLAIMLAFSLGCMVICGMSSSSILQLTSVWLMFCFVSAFTMIYKNYE